MKKYYGIIQKLRNDISMEKIAMDLNYSGCTSIIKRLQNLNKKIIKFF